MPDIKIKEEFKSLIPSLTAEEYEGLETSIIQEGCRDKIVTWKGYIIDGHNRYEICKKNNIAFEVLEKDNFETELDVKIWMIDNQFDRRNLPELVRMDLALERKSFVEQRAKGRKQQTQFNNNDTDRSPVTYPPEEQGKTLEILAKQAGVSYGKLFQYNKVLEKGTEEEVQAVKNNEISVKGAYQKIQRAERLEKNKATQWPQGRYRIIYADPPWQYGDERAGGNHGGAIDHYPTMSLQDLSDMPVDELAEDDAVLFLWVTAPLLEDSFRLLNCWGFKYKTQFIWDKVKHNMGHYNSVRHELLLIATKGSCTPDHKKLFDSVQTVERTDQHSEKPEEFRKIIETLYTYGNKIELFSRKRIAGWEVYGNEL